MLNQKHGPDTDRQLVTIYSTIWNNDPDYCRLVQVLDWRELGYVGLIKSITRTTRADVVIINGALDLSAKWRDLLVAALARISGRGTKLVISDATWLPRSSPGEQHGKLAWRVNGWWGQRLLDFLADDRTIVCFLSRAEVDDFLAHTRAPTGRAVFTPFFEWASGEAHVALPRAGGPLPPRPADPYVFVGGDTLRDWDLLAEALGDCGVPVRVATRQVGRSWPANFVVSSLSSEEFFTVAARATVGALALLDDTVRSAGQQTYLNLLRLGVPVVIADAPGVRDHLEGFPGASITPAHDPAAMRAEVLRLFGQERDQVLAQLVNEGLPVLERHYSRHAYLMRLVCIAASLGAGDAGSVTPTLEDLDH